MATPQVAGLAAYLLAIRPGLTPQQLKAMLLETSSPVPLEIDPDCSDWPTPAPLIQAYPALLALDQPNQGPEQAPVRRAILDINTSGTFTGDDILSFLTAFETAQGELDFGRADLNNDGRTGGNVVRPFDLDLDRIRTASGVSAQILGETVAFNETGLTDLAILCYYAYSGLYAGSSEARDQLLEPYRQQGQCGEENAGTTVSATFPEAVTPEVPALFRLTAVNTSGEPVAGVAVQLEIDGGTVSDATGSTGADGVYEYFATMAPEAAVITITATVREAPGGAVIATLVRSAVRASPPRVRVLQLRVEAGGQCSFQNASSVNDLQSEAALEPGALSAAGDCGVAGGSASNLLVEEVPGGWRYSAEVAAYASYVPSVHSGTGGGTTIFDFVVEGEGVPYAFEAAPTGTISYAYLKSGANSTFPVPGVYGCAFSPVDTVGYSNACEGQEPVPVSPASGLLPPGAYRLFLQAGSASTMGSSSGTAMLLLGASAPPE